VVIKSPTLLADKDPYNSQKPTLKPEPTPELEKEKAEKQKIGDGPDGSQATSTPVGAIDLNRPPASGSGPAGERGNQAAQSVVPIRKAIPVEPQEQKPVEIRRAMPVKPLDQENANETLLKSATTPAPSDLNQ